MRDLFIKSPAARRFLRLALYIYFNFGFNASGNFYFYAILTENFDGLFDVNVATLDGESSFV